MPPRPKREKPSDEEQKELDELLYGPLGCGTPVRISEYDFVGHTTSPLRFLLDRNLHPSKRELRTWGYKNMPYGSLNPAFWGRFLERMKTLQEHRAFDWRQVNIWSLRRLGILVYVYESLTGEGYMHIPQDRGMDRLELVLRTDRIRLSTTRKIAAEEKARKSLLKRLSREQKRQLALLGAFIEVGGSGVHYRITLNRPTLAYRAEKIPKSRKQQVRFLACLCFHPIGYYDNTFAGCMTPSAEMLAQLLKIRTNEHEYWKRSGQHGLDDVLNGI